jgi:hypothetical protein
MASKGGSMNKVIETSEEILMSKCKCIIYHPPIGGAHWKQLLVEFKQTGNTMLAMQLWSACADRELVVKEEA